MIPRIMAMNYLEKIYLAFHKLFSQPQERGRYSAGYWQNKVRGDVLKLIPAAAHLLVLDQLHLETCSVNANGGRLLEIGCGEGLMLSQLHQHNPRIEAYGIDSWSDVLSGTRNRLEPSIKLLCADARSLPFKGASFDIIVCVNVFICVESIAIVKSILREASRICRKDARLIIEFRNKANPLLWLKYKLAKYYDPTTKKHPLSTYYRRDISRILGDVGFCIRREHALDSLMKGFTPIIIVEAQKV